jgi:hypothetical protein
MRLNKYLRAEVFVGEKRSEINIDDSRGERKKIFNELEEIEKISENRR